jgi:hypothetical protein
MSVIVEMINTLEKKVLSLVSKNDLLEKKNQDLEFQLKKSEQVVQLQKKEIEQLKQDFKTLQIANTLLGSKVNTKDTKLKINSLIREIDFCIAHLSD